MEIDLPSIQFLSEADGQRKSAISKELGEASKDYAGGNVPDAVKKLRDVLKSDPKNQEAMKLIKKIGEDINMTLNDLGSNESISEVSSVREMMAKVLNYFYIGEYGLAVENSQRILLLMPDNKLALKRMGSSYYMLGDTDNALKAWKEASALDPGDEKLKAIINYLEGHNKAKEKQ
jgi:tetratricopeptide (TPR) repeat protein